MRPGPEDRGEAKVNLPGRSELHALEPKLVPLGRARRRRLVASVSLADPVELCAMSAVLHPDPQTWLAAALARFVSEGLDRSETAAVLAQTLTWTSDTSHDAVPLLRAFSMLKRRGQ